jgi:hypothetical protein
MVVVLGYGFRLSETVKNGKVYKVQCGHGFLVKNDEECDDSNLINMNAS